MECKHNEKKELLFCNRVEDRLDLKETRANLKFVYLRCVGNDSRRDGIGWPTKWIAGSTAAGERRCEPDLWGRASGMAARWREGSNSSERCSEVGGSGEWRSEPDLWRIAGGMAATSKAMVSGEWLRSKQDGNRKFGEKFLLRALIYQVYLHCWSDRRMTVLRQT
jgi:hypothetical protein